MTSSRAPPVGLCGRLISRPYRPMVVSTIHRIGQVRIILPSLSTSDRLHKQAHTSHLYCKWGTSPISLNVKPQISSDKTTSPHFLDVTFRGQMNMVLYRVLQFKFKIP